MMRIQMIELRDRYTHIDEAVFFPIGNEFLLRDLNKNRYFRVSESIKLLWDLFDGSNTVEQILEKVIQEHPEEDAEPLKKQILALIEKLVSLNLIYKI
jgi:hypothetical protein